MTHAREYGKTAIYREDITAVLSEIARLRRHSDAFARLVGDLLHIHPDDRGDAATAVVLRALMARVLRDPAELDLIASAVLEAPGEGPGPAVDG